MATLPFSWAFRDKLEDAVSGGAPFGAEQLTLEEGEVIRGGWAELPVPESPTTPRTRSGLSPGDGGSDDVLAAAAAVLEVCALARLAPAAQVDFVDGGRVVLGRDEPNAVLEADFFGVLVVEGLSSKDVAGDSRDVLEVGGGWAHIVR